MSKKIKLIPARHVAGNSGVGATFEMGDGPAVLTQGFAHWESVTRSQKTSLTRFVGGDPIGQDLPILLDGFRRGKDIQYLLDALLYQSVPKTGGVGSDAPTVWRINGPIYYPWKRWIVADIEFGEAIRDRERGLVRQAATLKLIEFVSGDRLKVKRRRTVKPKRKKRVYKSHKGDTLRKVAIKFYGKGHFARQLGKAQKKPIRDVGKKLKPGTKIRLPRLLGRGYK